MKIAVLPFNATPTTRHALARQYANFAADIARNVTQSTDIEASIFLAPIQDGNLVRYGFFNSGEELNEIDKIQNLFQRTRHQVIVEGLLDEREGGGGTLIVRAFKRDELNPIQHEEFTYLPGGEYSALRGLVKLLLDVHSGTPIPDQLEDDEQFFGTSDTEAFKKFLIGFDATQYIEQSQGQVLKEFTPKIALDALKEAEAADPDWEAPFLARMQLCRLCTRFGIGDVQMIEAALLEMKEAYPEDERLSFSLGELYAATQRGMDAIAAFEEAHRIKPDEPAILIRLGMMQMNGGMPANAEKSFRRALEVDPEKQAADYLAQVLQQTNRAHEVPAIYRAIVEERPEMAMAHARLAMAEHAAGNGQAALKICREAMETLDDLQPIRRVMAQLLAQDGQFDEALDLFEDALDEEPNNLEILTHYAQTLEAAGRTQDLPDVLNTMLSSTQDPNVKAQTLGRLIELEQPKRADAVREATEKAEAGDVQGALDQLKPMVTWLADYWKLWAALAAIYNHLEEGEEAEKAADKLIQLFPAFEQGYGEKAKAMALQGPEKAEEAFLMMRQILAQNNGSVNLALHYGMAAKRAGHEEDARNIARQVREALRGNQEIEPILAELEK